MSEKKKGFTRDELLVITGAALLQGAVIGVLTNCTSVLMTQIRTELGFSMTRLSSYYTVRAIASALCSSVYLGIFARFRKKLPVMTAIMAVITGAYYMLLLADSNIAWYLSAILVGMSMSTVSLTVPCIVEYNFPDRAGTVMGIVSSASGIGGVLFNPVVSALIKGFGWKTAAVSLATIALVMELAGLKILFREGDLKLVLPAEKKKGDSAGKGESSKTAIFLLLCAVLLTPGYIIQIAQYISSYSVSIGYSLSVGATMTSMMMVGNVGGKFLFGYLCDKLGVWKSFIVGLGCVGASLAMLMAFKQSLIMLYAACVLFGFIYGVNVVGISRSSSAAYGREEAPRYLGYHYSVNYVFNACFSMLVGMVYDSTGSFEPVFTSAIAVDLLSIGAVLVIMNMLKKAARAD